MPRTEFTARFKARQQLLGTFVKTPTSHASEILGGAGFDFVVIDEEHAPIDRSATDQILLGCRANDIAGLVRVPSSMPSAIQSVLDCGADGVLVPHVASVEVARSVVAASRYRGGIRGFSNSPRAGGYGAAGMWAHIEAQDRDIAVLAMIEDREAIDAIEDILAVEGLDGIFIGRGDLTVSLERNRPVIRRSRMRSPGSWRRPAMRENQFVSWSVPSARSMLFGRRGERLHRFVRSGSPARQRQPDPHRVQCRRFILKQIQGTNMYAANDPRAALNVAAPRSIPAPTAYKGAEYARFYDAQPQEVADGSETYYARGQNLIVAHTRGKAGLVLSRTGHSMNTSFSCRTGIRRSKCAGTARTSRSTAIVSSSCRRAIAKCI
uniref:HpcH/HpaI aldolase family protein n=1 Tax=Neorhizobium sp. EC2-8 TaxID=3129230 RepID=UPI0031012C1E